MLLKAVGEAKVDYFLLDRLNLRYGMWTDLKEMLQRHYPHLTAEYGRILFDQRHRAEYTDRLRSTLKRLIAERGMEGKARFCF